MVQFAAASGRQPAPEGHPAGCQRDRYLPGRGIPGRGVQQSLRRSRISSWSPCSISWPRRWTATRTACSWPRRASRVRTQSASRAPSRLAAQCPFHDSTAPNGVNPWQTMDLYPFIDRINQSHTAIYMTVGWYDIFTADMFHWYNNLSVPKRLTVRPTDHSQVSANLSDLNYGTEALRWLDYWLKGIDNGIMDEAAHPLLPPGWAEKGHLADLRSVAAGQPEIDHLLILARAKPAASPPSMTAAWSRPPQRLHPPRMPTLWITRPPPGRKPAGGRSKRRMFIPT